jgi:hypothetical protein
LSFLSLLVPVSFIVKSIRDNPVNCRLNAPGNIADQNMGVGRAVRVLVVFIQNRVTYHESQLPEITFRQTPCTHGDIFMVMGLTTESDVFATKMACVVIFSEF